MAESRLLLYLYSFVIVGVIIGLVKFTLWRNLFFWILLVISTLAIFAGSPWLGHLGGAFLATVVLVPYIGATAIRTLIRSKSTKVFERLVVIALLVLLAIPLAYVVGIILYALLLTLGTPGH